MNPGKFSESSLSRLRKTPFCDIERALQKGNFCSFAEKDRGLDPKDLPSCTPARVERDCFSKLSCIRHCGGRISHCGGRISHCGGRSRHQKPFGRSNYDQGWRQEFSDGGLTLPTRGLKYGYRVP